MKEEKIISDKNLAAHQHKVTPDKQRDSDTKKRVDVVQQHGSMAN